MNLNNLFVLFFAVCIVQCAPHHDEKNELYAADVQAVRDEAMEAPPEQEPMTLADSFPMVYPEYITLDPETTENTAQEAKHLLSRVGLTLENIHLGIYLGDHAFGCFHHGDTAKFVLLLGNQEQMIYEHNVDILPSFAYTEFGTGPGGIPILTMPFFKNTMVSELVFVHEYTHVTQGNAGDLAKQELDAYVAEKMHFTKHYPGLWKVVLQKAKPTYSGTISASFYQTCTSVVNMFPHPMNAFEKFIMIQSIMLMIVLENEAITPAQFDEQLWEIINRNQKNNRRTQEAQVSIGQIYHG